MDALHRVPGGKEVLRNAALISEMIQACSNPWAFGWSLEGDLPQIIFQWAPLPPPEDDPGFGRLAYIYIMLPWEMQGRTEPTYSWFASQDGRQGGVETGYAKTLPEAIAAVEAWYSRRQP